MRKEQCQKCKKYEYVAEHHILPRSTFGDNEETSLLCSNCHTEYHQLLGRKGLKNKSIEFHLETYFKWLCGLGVVALLVYLML